MMAKLQGDLLTKPIRRFSSQPDLMWPAFGIIF